MTASTSEATPTQRSSIFAPDLLAGQVAFVTGGGTGIGLAIARELGRLGCTTIIASRKLENVEKTAAELTAEGLRCEAMALDIRNPERVSEVIAAILAKHGRLDILVNNAGGQFPSPAAAISVNGWNAVISTNLNGTWYVTQEVARQWMLEHGGKIVSIVADMWRGFPGMVHTGAARAGVVNLTKTLAVEWAPFGIRINAVAPGVIASSGLTRYPPEVAANAWKSIPMKRLGTVEEIAWAVVFLVSPAGAFITGETMKVDGGNSLWGDRWPVPDPE